ncbi:MAG: hypothetical protein WD053_05500 [Gracilimonas sp.]
MPILFSGYCDSCEYYIWPLALGKWGVIKDLGDAEILPHPGEHDRLSEIGLSGGRHLLKNRNVQITTVLCTNCYTAGNKYGPKGLLFRLFQRQRSKHYYSNFYGVKPCSNCGGTEFKELRELIDEKLNCPSCNEKNFVFEQNGIS